MEDSQNEVLETVKNEQKGIETTPMELKNSRLSNDTFLFSIFSIF